MGSRWWHFGGGWILGHVVCLEYKLASLGLYKGCCLNSTCGYSPESAMVCLQVGIALWSKFTGFLEGADAGLQGFSEVTFELRPESIMGTSWGRGRNLGREHNLCKGPGAGSGLVYWKNIEDAQLAGAEWVTEREGGGEGREGTGQVVWGLGGLREDLGFYPSDGEPPRAGGRGPTRLRCSWAPSDGC